MTARLPALLSATALLLAGCAVDTTEPVAPTVPPEEQIEDFSDTMDEADDDAGQDG